MKAQVIGRAIWEPRGAPGGAPILDPEAVLGCASTYLGAGTVTMNYYRKVFGTADAARLRFMRPRVEATCVLERRRYRFTVESFTLRMDIEELHREEVERR